jgi:hypothetical protein
MAHTYVGAGRGGNFKVLWGWCLELGVMVIIVRRTVRMLFIIVVVEAYPTESHTAAQ